MTCRCLRQPGVDVCRVESRPSEYSTARAVVLGLLVLFGAIACSAPGRVEDLDQMRKWIDATLDDQATVLDDNNDLLWATTQRDALAQLRATYLGRQTDLQRTAYRRTQACHDAVAAAGQQKAEDGQNELEQQVDLLESNRMVGEGNVRREFYYRRQLLHAMENSFEKRLRALEISMARLGAGLADALCKLETAHQKAVNRYRDTMMAVRDYCGNECEGAYDAYRDSRDTLDASFTKVRRMLKEQDIFDALGWRKRGEEIGLPDYDPPGVSDCVGRYVRTQSSQALALAEAELLRQFEPVRAELEDVDCLPENWEQVAEADKLLAVGATCSVAPPASPVPAAGASLAGPSLAHSCRQAGVPRDNEPDDQEESDGE